MLLAAGVIGSGIMAERLAAGNGAIALLANTSGNRGRAGRLIASVGSISGAHFNPVISAVAWRNGQIDARTAAVLRCSRKFVDAVPVRYSPTLMFELPGRAGLDACSDGRVAVAVGSRGHSRAGVRRVPMCIRQRSRVARAAVDGCRRLWFTASTSFANPAITIGRSLSDTFAGIRPIDVPGFIGAQLAGASVGVALLRLFAKRDGRCVSAARETLADVLNRSCDCTLTDMSALQRRLDLNAATHPHLFSAAPVFLDPAHAGEMQLYRGGDRRRHRVARVSTAGAAGRATDRARAQ